MNSIHFFFKPDFRADSVAIADAVRKIAGNEKDDFQFIIHWSDEISKVIEYCETVYAAALNYLNPESMLYQSDQSIVESIVETIPHHLSSTRQIMEDAHKRIGPLIEGMSFKRAGVLGCKTPIQNYLTHCNFYALRTVLYPLTNTLLKDTEYHYLNIVNGFKESWFFNGFYGYVYGMEGDILSDSVYHLTDKNKNALANVKYGISVRGTKEDLSSTNYEFYDHSFVPQVEFQLIGKEDVVLYDGNRMLFLKGKPGK